MLKVFVLQKTWLTSAMKSELCPVTLQVGACIVNKEKKIVGIGYNGMPNGCSDDELPWRRTHDNWLETKYPYGWYILVY